MASEPGGSAAAIVDRAGVLAYRLAAGGLGRSAARAADLPELDLGIQDTPAGSARLAVAARTTGPVEDDTRLAEAGLIYTWSLRGAPHLHRRADAARLARAVWPLSDADARARIASPRIKEGAGLGLAAFTAAATAMREAVSAPIPRGEVSTYVSAHIPASLTYDCEVCRARHISGALFQQVGLPSGTRLLPGTSPAVLAPIEARPGVPASAAGTGELVTAYLRLHGPAGPAEAAAFLGTTQAALRAVWPDGLAPVRVADRTAWIPEDRLPALRAAPRPDLVRLLPPSDPYLGARDRALLVPDAKRRSAVWKAIGGPGTLLVDGEIAGLWRARMSGRRLTVAVTPFEPLTAARAAAVDAGARRMAEVRSAADVRVTVEV